MFEIKRGSERQGWGEGRVGGSGGRGGAEENEEGGASVLASERVTI